MKSIVRPRRRSVPVDVDTPLFLVERDPVALPARGASRANGLRSTARVLSLPAARARRAAAREADLLVPAPEPMPPPTPIADKVVSGLITLASFIAWLIPLPFWHGLTLFGGVVGMYGKTRATVLANIDHATLGKSPGRWTAWWIGCQQIATHLRTVVMLLRSGTTRSQRRGKLAFHEDQHLLPWLDQRGIVIVGPHAGPYPLLGFMALPWLRKQGFTGDVVVVARLFRPFRSSAVMDWFSRTFARAGTTILPVDTPPRTLALRLRRTLTNNGVVVLLVDEPTVFKSLQIPMFDDEIEMPEGPVRLAHATGSIIVPCIARYEPHRTMSVTFGPPIEPVASPRATLTMVAQALEPLIRDSLPQWAMLTPIWKRVTPVESSAGPGRADLHLHTPGSDGLVTIDEWRRAAAARGVDVIAITDHDHLDTIREWQRTGGGLSSEDQGSMVEVIPGVEVTARGRAVHVGVLFGEAIPDEVPAPGTRLPDIVRWARAVPGSVVILVHPLPLIWRWQLQGLAREDLLPDAIETRYPFVAGKTAVLERTARRLGIATLGASDAHLAPDHLGVNLTGFEGRTARDLLRSIRQGRTTALTGHQAERLPGAVARNQAFSSWLLPLRWIPGVARLNRSLLLRSRLAAGHGPYPNPAPRPEPASSVAPPVDGAVEATPVSQPADLVLR